MKIFILPTSYPNERHPQKDIFIFEQAKQLAHMGHQVTVLHTEKLSTKELLCPLDKSIKVVDDGFAVRYTTQQKTFMESKFPLLSKSAFLRNAEKLYSAAVKEQGKPDVIYAHFSQWAGYAGGVISQRYGVPLVTIEHFSGLVRDKLPTSLTKCVKATINTSCQFICVSEKLKQSIIQNIKPQKEIHVVSNMIDRCFSFQPVVPHDGFVFSAIGRLTPPKNYQTLINAFIKAFGPEEKIYLRIGGDGEQKEELKGMINSAGRQHQISLLGNLTREQTVTEYINCDSFALSSAWETYGLVYREALAIGRPIVTTDHGGFSKSDWQDEYGYMVPIRDVEAFAKAMRDIVAEYDKFDLKRISELCLLDCAPDMIGKKIERLLYKAVEKCNE